LVFLQFDGSLLVSGGLDLCTFLLLAEHSSLDRIAAVIVRVDDDLASSIRFTFSSRLVICAVLIQLGVSVCSLN
jgi:hypothetical protein